ncbi:hypothetical protein BK660_26710 [Pseudomonas brassicacearum]|uniref:Uncharacterized protein n=1 Tax=Pseudomonas brassicacearum TaxID=930166 RepID=A0A423HS99_9PSED|nr:hypothetical protein BK660_26710 [Pseudomonas brassicacearum]
MKFNDIDILIIHEKAEYDSCQLAILCKQKLRSNIENSDVIILSKPEEVQHSFITKSNAKKIGTICARSIEEDINCITKKISENNKSN